MDLRRIDRPLSLTNDGRLELVFIGTGNAFSLENGQTNLLVIKGEDHLLIDLGPVGINRLHESLGIHPTAIRAFLPTHSHADHIGGLESLTVFNRFVARPRQGAGPLQLVTTREYSRQLWELSLRGGLGFNEPWQRNRLTGPEDLFDMIYAEPHHLGDREIWRANVGSIKLELFRTDHVKGSPDPSGKNFNSYGVLIDDRVFFSGDTVYDPDLIVEYSDRADWFFQDASLSESPLHASIEELASLPEPIRRRMYLVHYPDGAELTPAAGFAGWAVSNVSYILS